MTEKLDIINFNTFRDLYDPSNNKTINIITIYEKTSIFGLRKQQIAKGAPSTLDKDILKKCTTLNEIVEKEYLFKKMPFIICRKLPNNTCEYWKVKDLIDIL
jgi:hypothetical protein